MQTESIPQLCPVQSKQDKKMENVEKMIAGLENRVEEHIRFAVRELQNMPAEKLLKPSADGGWSIAQCIEHLNSYGLYYIPRLEKGLAARSDEAGHYKSSWPGNYFTKMMEPGSGKKMKAFKDHIPSADLDAHAVVAEFLAQQERLLHCLRRAQHTNLNRVKIPVSIASWLRLNAGDVLRFVIAHDERHIQQARRNL